MLISFQVGVSCKWANDSQHLLLEHFDTICYSPSQIYHSALPLSHSSSLVRKCYGEELSGEVKVVMGLPVEWGDCFRTVIFHTAAMGLASWKDTIAVGLSSGKIITLNGSIGSQTAILSGHTDWVRSLAFSSDGGSLVSGGHDMVIKLWDVRTGGVVKDFHGHTDKVLSVSVSVDYTTIVSGSCDKTICLWDIQTGGCHHVIRQLEEVNCVNFFPLHSQHFISTSGNMVQQWDINGHQINPSYSGSCAAFSFDGIQLVLCQGADIVVQNSGSGVAVAQFHIPDSSTRACCFSPDGRLVAVAALRTVYIWDITDSDHHLAGTFEGHSNRIDSLVFSSTSSLVTSCWDRSVKFWQIGTLSIDVGDENMYQTTKAINLQAKDGVFISGGLDGVVRTWDISTGLCKSSLKTPAKDHHHCDVRLVNGRSIYTWHEDRKIYIWDVEKDKLIRAIDADLPCIRDLRLSEDGSKVLCLRIGYIEAWSTWTGEVVGKIRVGIPYDHIVLILSGPSVWVHSPYSLACDGWDLGILGSSPCQLPQTPVLHLSDTKLWDIGQSRIRDTTTGKVVFQLGGRFANPLDVQLDGQYFLVHSRAREVLILDFTHVLLW